MKFRKRLCVAIVTAVMTHAAVAWWVADALHARNDPAVSLEEISEIEVELIATVPEIAAEPELTEPDLTEPDLATPEPDLATPEPDRATPEPPIEVESERQQAEELAREMAAAQEALAAQKKQDEMRRQREAAAAEARERERKETLRQKRLAELREQERLRQAEQQRAREQAKARAIAAAAERKRREQANVKPKRSPTPAAGAKRGGPTKGPICTRKPAPRYPVKLKRQGIGGVVVVQVGIDARGRVTSTSLSRSSGHRELDEAALTGVKRWRFDPALKNGVKVSSSTRINVVFKAR